MRITIIVHDEAEAPRSYNVTGSHDEIDMVADEVHGTLAHLFREAHDALDTKRPVCEHRSFEHGVPASGIRAADCVRNGTLR